MARPDANQIALRAARRILDAAHDFTGEVAGKTLSFRCTPLAAPSWPGALNGLDPDVDRPWPTPVAVDVSWEGGAARLIAECDIWKGSDEWRHAVALRVKIAATNREVVWVTLPSALAEASDGSTVPIRASVSLPKPIPGEDPASFTAQSAAIRAFIKDAGVPLITPAQAHLCSIALPDGELNPDAREVFARLLLIGAIKHAWFERRDRAGFTGTPFVEVPFVGADVQSGGGLAPIAPPNRKFQSVWPLPGGVRSYADTLRALLEYIEGQGSIPVTELERHIRERYQVTGKAALAGYMRLLRQIGFVEVTEGAASVTDDGRLWLGQPPAALFGRLHSLFMGMIEFLVLAEVAPELPMPRIRPVICAVLEVEWESDNQVMFRRNWLLSLGLTERTPRGDTTTDEGRAALTRYSTEAATARDLIRQALATARASERDPSVAGLGDDADQTPDAAEAAAASARTGEHLVLDARTIASHLGTLQVEPRLLEQLAAAVSAGKHVLFVGPPGTGKTELALALARAATAEGYCQELFTATASADWTTFDVIGGYAMRKDQTIEFRPGAFLRALQEQRWLLIDEINRADVDRAFGELMTVLAGQGTDTHYELRDGRPVTIGTEEGHTFRVLPSFRVLATMNVWDKASLFRLSYALQRRFALITVGLPGDAIYARILSTAAVAGDLLPPLADAHLATMHRLFSHSQEGLLSLRAIGPAVALDVLRYLRRRGAEADGVAEALEMFVLPQLQGLGAAQAKAAKNLCTAGLGFSQAARASLEERFDELFPDLAALHD
ncbi:MAG: hypothetical protein AMXMBFR64_38660 [Myxococcales bacterium]